MVEEYDVALFMRLVAALLVADISCIAGRHYLGLRLASEIIAGIILCECAVAQSLP